MKLEYLNGLKTHDLYYKDSWHFIDYHNAQSLSERKTTKHNPIHSPCVFCVNVLTPARRGRPRAEPLITQRRMKCA